MDAGSTTARLDVSDSEAHEAASAARNAFGLYPLQSLVASAQRLTNASIAHRGSGTFGAQAWQEDGWEMFDLVGEQRFLTTTLANRVGQARFFVGKVPTNPIEEPEPLEDDTSTPARVFASFGTTPAQRSQMVSRLASNLFIAGDGWFVGIPRWRMPGQPTPIDRPSITDLSIDDLEWRMLSVTEVQFTRGEVQLQLGEAPDEIIKAAPDDLFMIRVWRPHPRRYWQADSPTRSSLPVLRELVGLTMHISAQVDSRLAGAGLLIVPQSAKRALQVAAGISEDSNEDPFTEALMEAMLTPIADRANASAVVPLVVTVPDDAASLIRHITFDKPLDIQVERLREEAIRRLALGQDAPPELLLGTAGMNHWGAWLVREDVVTTHIEPPLALVCDAITTQYLWPVLEQTGMSPEEARDYVVWYDVSHMVQRPNRLADALTLHDKGAIGDETLREAGGFTDSDAPPQVDEAVELALKLVQTTPTLLDDLPRVVASIRAILPGGSGLDPATPALEVDPTTDHQDATSKAAGGSGQPKPGDQPGPTIAGQTTSRADESARTATNPGGPPARPAAGFAADPIRLAKPGWAPKSSEAVAALTAAGNDSEYEDSVCIVAVPDPTALAAIPAHEDQSVHATLIYLGHILDPASHDAATISEGGEPGPMEITRLALIDAIEQAVETCGPPEAAVTGVGTLGSDDPPAHVVFLHSPELATLRDTLLSNPIVARLYDEGSFAKYPNYRPHVTLGYGDQVDENMRADADMLQTMQFDHLELWWGNEHISFSLGDADPVETGADDADAEYQREGERSRLEKVAAAADDAGTIQGILS